MLEKLCEKLGSYFSIRRSLIYKSRRQRCKNWEANVCHGFLSKRQFLEILMADSDFQYNRTIGSQKTDFRKIGFEEYFYFIVLVNNLEGVNYNSCKIAKKIIYFAGHVRGSVASGDFLGRFLSETRFLHQIHMNIIIIMSDLPGVFNLKHSIVKRKSPGSYL